MISTVNPGSNTGAKLRKESTSPVLHLALINLALLGRFKTHWSTAKMESVQRTSWRRKVGEILRKKVSNCLPWANLTRLLLLSFSAFKLNVFKTIKTSVTFILWFIAGITNKPRGIRQTTSRQSCLCPSKHQTVSVVRWQEKNFCWKNYISSSLQSICPWQIENASPKNDLQPHDVWGNQSQSSHCDSSL